MNAENPLDLFSSGRMASVSEGGWAVLVLVLVPRQFGSPLLTLAQGLPCAITRPLPRTYTVLP